MKANGSFRLIVYLSSVSLLPVILCSDDYEMARKLLADKLASNYYNADLRPVRNASAQMTISTNFTLMSVVEIDDVSQKFVTNGFIIFCWKDQLVTWNPQDYGGIDSFVPQPRHIWRPRVILLNTLDSRDPFEDDVSPLSMYFTGDVCWAPGALFMSSCNLDMEKYPFDTQQCSLIFCSMSYFTDKVQYEAQEDLIDTTFYESSGEWILVKSSITISEKRLASDAPSSCVDLQFVLERRPEFYVFNIILPVVFMTFLNMLVFIMANDTASKISFGMTVLLALSVFLSMVSTMIPRSSEARPALTTYLLILLSGSVLTVVASVLIVTFHTKCQSNCPKRKYSLSQEHHQQHGGASNGTPRTRDFPSAPPYDDGLEAIVKGGNCCICNWKVDRLCFLGFFTIWVSANIWFGVTVFV